MMKVIVEARHMVIESILSPCNDVSIGFYVGAGGLNSISRQKKLCRIRSANHTARTVEHDE